MLLRRLASSAPSSLAGVGGLYGVGGLAVTYARDYVLVEARDKPKVRVRILGQVEQEEKNRLSRAARMFLSKAGISVGLHIRVHKRVPLGLGLGSSASSLAAMLYALNSMIGSELRVPELLEIAGEGVVGPGEEVRTESVAASMLGGLAVILSRDTFKVASLAFPDEAWIVLIVPLTLRGKSASPPQSFSSSHLSMMLETASEFLIGVVEKDLVLMGEAINRPTPVEEAVSTIIPGYWEAKERALEQGALGFNVAGYGPSMYAVAHSSNLLNIMDEVTTVFAKHNVSIDVKVVKPDLEGARLEDPDLLAL